MTDPENGDNGTEPFPVGHDGVEDHATLKKSLSKITNGSHRHSPPNPESNFVLINEAAQSSKPNKSSPPLFVDIPKMPTPADTAFTALQYLPTPLLVLSSSNLVILANEAMGRLLGLDESGALQKVYDDGEVQDLSVTEALWGQTLSQLGVDMLQDGEPIWVNWEVRR